MRTNNACHACSKVVCTCRHCKHSYSRLDDDEECRCGLTKRKCPYGVTSEKWEEEMKQSETN